MIMKSTQLEKLGALIGLVVVALIIVAMMALTGCSNPVESKEPKSGPKIKYQLTRMPSDTLTVYGDNHEDVNNHFAIYVNGEPVFSAQSDSLLHRRTSIEY